MRLSALILHRHQWQEINIERHGATAPNGRDYIPTYISVRCSGCGEMIHRVYYRDISDRQPRRGLR